MSAKKQKILFVTVGTTLFQPLIDAVASKAALDWMMANGFTQLILQYGKGHPPQDLPSSSSFHTECYAFKPSLQEDMARADWIVCHAGAGTLMEAVLDRTMRRKKEQRVVVTVINSRLMDNHQTELAYALRDRGYLQVVEDPRALCATATWKRLAAAEQAHPAVAAVVEQEEEEDSTARDFSNTLNRFLGI